METLSLIIPCYNEVWAIPRMNELLRSFRAMIECQGAFQQFEVIIVDDGSDELTKTNLNQLSQAKVVTHASRRGYGAALKTGLSLAKGDVLAFLDMDGTYNPSDLMGMHSVLKRTNSDIVFGSRMQGANGMPKLRRLGNRIYSRTLRYLYNSPVEDVCTGLRLFKKSLLPITLSVPEDGLNFSVALTVSLLKRGVTCSETPITYQARIGDSKLGVVRDGLAFFHSILRRTFH